MNLLTNPIAKRKKIIKRNNQVNHHPLLLVLMKMILVPIRKRWRKWKHNWSWWKSIRFPWRKKIRKKMINHCQSPQSLNLQQRIMNHLLFHRPLLHPWIPLLFWVLKVGKDKLSKKKEGWLELLKNHLMMMKVRKVNNKLRLMLNI